MVVWDTVVGVAEVDAGDGVRASKAEGVGVRNYKDSDCDVHSGEFGAKLLSGILIIGVEYRFQTLALMFHADEQ
jgi:hypothetical protein